MIFWKVKSISIGQNEMQKKYSKFQLWLRCCKVWKCKCKFAKNLKWNCIWNSLKIAQRESFFSNEKGFCISKEIPRAWRVAESKRTYNLQLSVEFPHLQSFPDDIWWKTNCLTISISSSHGLGTDQVIPTHTLSMVLGTYETISLWSISTTCTGYQCRSIVIPIKTTICSER